ncbi:macrolide 2'-phosphotransferase [Georgenia sp. H159]|uniref:macrolide 2'-phosphotransferase n=1 Tax=Georgenia sp. H159 TaxID=3076115 RepID=UPI002D77410F|nr:macrolide 2'-phosphotransferase [Georgenia sp. H159]
MSGDEDLLARAASHGLRLHPDSVRRNDAGLDFRVAFAVDVHGRQWVLRVPRRPDVVDGVAQEQAILAFASRHLLVAVPDWHVVADDLVAYPVLPGRPGLTIEGEQATWHLDPASPRYAEDLGRLLAALHDAPLDEARELGIEVRSPDEVRESWANDVALVSAEFDVDPGLEGRLAAWLDDDGLWPEETVFTHGELYPAHVLIDDDDAVTGVLDWTTARGDDPARDFMYQHAFAPPEAFAATTRAYTEAGGQPGERLGERCAALMAAGPVGYGLFALTTGRDEHRAAAQAQLRAA